MSRIIGAIKFYMFTLTCRRYASKNNELSNSTYKVKKRVCPLSMEVDKIHICLNDCILY
jgi:hypothetical protein